MKTIILILSVFLVTSCSNDDNNNTVFEPVDLTFTTIAKGSLNGNEGIVQSGLVINNDTEWQNLINQMNSTNTVSNSFLETDIDFNTFSIIAVFLDVKPTDWEVEIITITENEDNITLNIMTEELIFDTTSQSQPYHIVKIEKTTKEIVVE